MKDVLILTYYFPPSGGPGVQRILKFVKYLPEFGWRPTVVTVDPAFAAYPDLDPGLEVEIPPHVEVYRTRSWDPYALYARMLGKEKAETVGVGFIKHGEAGWQERFARWIRANVFLPDARVGWVPFAARAGLRLAKTRRFDALLTTGPPHSTHLAGYVVSRTARLPWTADFRDPWTEIDFYGELPITHVARSVDRSLERLVLRSADAVTVVGPSMERAFGAHTNRPIHTIYNGFDEADFDITGSPVQPQGFEILHIGNMNAARNPEALWEALAAMDLRTELPEVRVRLVGNVDASVLESIERYGLRDAVVLEGYVPHEEAVGRTRSAPVLLLAINRVEGATGIITGKLFEYLAAGGLVLGIGPSGGDAADIIRRAGAGEMIDFDDAAGVERFLRDAYVRWKSGDERRRASTGAVRRYSRRAQTGELADVLKSVSERPAASPAESASPVA